MATRWGIISAGAISNDFVAALQLLSKDEHEVVAVAARSLQNAEKFAAKYGIKMAYGSYSELAKDPNVDVLYVGTVHTTHLKVATEMLKAGKPVLCEKPLCINLRETRELLKTARECGVFFMEAIWSRFFPAYKELSRRLKDGEIGDVVQVITSLGKNVSFIDRFHQSETGGGVTLEIGTYTVQIITLAMGGDKPLKVLAGGQLNENGVEETINASLVYSKGRMASLTACMKADYLCEAFIIGTKGSIKIPYPMWCPESLEGPWGISSYPLPKTSHKFNFENSQGLIYEAMEVRRCLKEGLLESPGMPHADSITVAQVLEEIRGQVATVYP